VNFVFSISPNSIRVPFPLNTWFWLAAQSH